MTPILRMIPLALAGLAASGCYYQDCPVQDARAYGATGYVEVEAPPPGLQAQVEVRPPKPEAASVWVDGRWDWQGRWVWVAGHWQTPRPGHVWTPPVARRTPQGRVQYYPGHWRPRDHEPPPVYREPGEVRVTVHPARPSSPVGEHVHVRTPQDRAAVPVQPPATEPSRPGQVETPRPDVRAQPPRPGTVRGAEPETAQPQPGTVRVTPPGAVQPGSVQGPTAEPVRPPVRPRGDVTGPGPETRRPTEGGGIRGPTAETVPLGCQLTTSRAPRGGYVTIRGTGFGSSPVVRVGGRIAPVVATEREQIRFQVPQDSRGGGVAVSVGNASASCGELTIVGR